MIFSMLVLLMSAVTGVDTTPPAIQVISPVEGSSVATNVVEFRGVTEWGGEVFSGPFPAVTDEYGEWTILLVLEPGENGAVFTATDAAGNEKSVRVAVTYEPEEPIQVIVAQEPEPARKAAVTATSTTTTTMAPTTTTVAPEPKTVVTGVEQWRPLVEKYFPDRHVATAMRVMACESGGNPDATNRSARAAGLFQHLKKYWSSRTAAAGYPGGDIFDPETNIAVSAWLVESDGWGHWTCY